MENPKLPLPKAPKLALINLDDKIKRIKEQYLRQFGEKFIIPHLSGVENDEESYRKKIAEIKNSFVNKLPPIR